MESGWKFGYRVINKKTGDNVIEAQTKHCFTDKSLKPINLKKVAPEFSAKFQNAIKE